MSRVLPGTAPQVVAHSQADMQPAFAWIEAHADACRGQWVAVRLVEPVLVASCPDADPIVADGFAGAAQRLCAALHRHRRERSPAPGARVGRVSEALLHVRV